MCEICHNLGGVHDRFCPRQPGAFPVTADDARVLAQDDASELRENLALAVDTYEREIAHGWSPERAALAVFDMRDDLDKLALAREYYKLIEGGTFSPRDAFISIMADHS